LQVLVELGADLDAKAGAGAVTPLQLAVRVGHPHMQRLLRQMLQARPMRSRKAAVREPTEQERERADRMAAALIEEEEREEEANAKGKVRLVSVALCTFSQVNIAELMYQLN
jgi:hypothetical protein